MIVTKPIDLGALEQELATAGVAVPRKLGRAGDDLHTYDAAGAPVDLPPAAAPIVEAHNAASTPTAVQAADDATDFQDLLSGAGQMAQLLGWNAATRQWAAAAGQWDALSPAQKTIFARRILRAVVVLVRRGGG